MFSMTEAAGSAPPDVMRLLDATTDGVLVLDVQGRPTWMNTGAERMLGLSRQRLPGPSLWDEPSEGPTAQLLRACRRAVEEGAPVTAEAHVPSLGAWLEARAFPTREGLLVQLRDVTPRHQLEAECAHLHALALRFRSLVESTTCVLWMTDAAGRMHADSPSWCAFTGQSREQWAEGAGYLAAIHPEDRAYAAAAWQRAFQARGVYEAEYRLRRPDGTYTPVVSRGVPVFNADGTVREWMGAISDITAQRRGRAALELLSEASAALNSTLELRPAMERLARSVVPRFAEWCAIYLSDGQGGAQRVAWADLQPARALRLRMEGLELESGPHNPRRVLESGKVEHFPTLNEQVLFGQELDVSRRTRRFAFAGLRGMTVPILLDGQVLGAITFAVGPSYRGYDAEDERVAVELAQRVGVTVEHAHLFEMARAARDRAEEANRVKDEFLATISHELRTPLTAILGWTQMLLGGRLPPERHRRALESVERSACMQRQLVENLLDISHIIAGKLHLEAQPVELPEVVHAALDAVRPSAASRGIQLDAEVEDGARLLLGDAPRLRQLVAILLTNALKFSERGGRVRLRLRQAAEEVVLEVTDTGQGIAATFLPHLFERFRQADVSVTRKHGGLGLELAIARHVVERHGGTIEARSEGEGHGSTFTVRLPVEGLATPAQEPCAVIR